MRRITQLFLAEVGKDYESSASFMAGKDERNPASGSLLPTLLLPLPILLHCSNNSFASLLAGWVRNGILVDRITARLKLGFFGFEVAFALGAGWRMDLALSEK